MNGTCVWRAGIAGHHLFAMAAEELCCQKIFLFCPCSGRGFSVFLHHFLHLHEKVIIYNPGYSVWDFCPFVGVSANIALVLQHLSQRVFIERWPSGGYYISSVHHGDYLRNCFAVGVHLKDFADYRRGIFINLKVPILINLEAQRNASAGAKAFWGVYIQAAPDFLWKLRTVIFGHSLKNALNKNPACILWNVLASAEDANAIFLELLLVYGAIIPISRETVKLIDENALKGLFPAILNHPQKFGAVVVGASQSPIDIFPDNRIAITFCIFIAGFQLSLNTLFCLTVWGKPGIYDYIHTSSPLSISFSFKKT